MDTFLSDERLNTLLEAAIDTEAALSWMVDRGGSCSPSEVLLKQLRAAIRELQPDFIGPYETCKGCNGSIEPGQEYCDGCL